MWRGMAGWTAALLACALAGIIPEALGARVALVIGNDAYRHVAPLRNAAADARAMADALREARFDVTVAFNQDRNGMNRLVRTVAGKVAGGDDVVVFFSGHGVQLGGVSYLLPVDIRDEDAAQVRDDAVTLQRLLDDLAERNPRFALFLVDACRDNPFSGKVKNVGTKGLAPTTPADGQMIIYAAGAGQKALDRLSDADRASNGLFTRVWLKEMRKPGVAVHEMARAVREEVKRLALGVGHAQVPALYDQSVGKFFFLESDRREPADDERKTASGINVDEAMWQEAKGLNTVAAYRAYGARFPRGQYAAMAEAAVEKLERESYERAVGASGLEALARFVKEFPESARRVEAEAEMERRRQAANKPKPVPSTSAESVTTSRPSPTATTGYADLQSFRECGECPEMVVIPAGEFEMGSTVGRGEDYEKPQHRARVGRFGLGKYEVTQGQWRTLMGGNPSYFSKCGDECPVEKVGWEDAQAYIRKLNEKVSGRSEGPYRLPSEAEWEYGCRGGVGGEEYCGGNDVNSLAWYGSNSGSNTQRVGMKKGSRWGLHDLSGNVFEWVQDCWNGSYQGAPRNGEAWTSGDCSRRVVRGGAWNTVPASVRSANRVGSDTSRRNDNLGFRVARTLP